jgi:DNA-binding Lrp family transcriptional regulator
MGPIGDKRERRPRFHRAAEPPAFRITDGDIEIVRLLARHRFLRSTQIAKLVGRSLDRTNDRLHRLFHAGYLDRPRAQLDRFPVDGSSHMVYALANDGARLLQQNNGALPRRLDLSHQNQTALRPFIEHQLGIMDFYVALECATRARSDVTLIRPDEIVANFPEPARAERNPLRLKVRMSHKGKAQDFGLVPDLLFGLRFPDGSRRCFMVEVDRGTMPISRTDIARTSFALKMRAYLAAYAAGQHQQCYGWKAFRVLTITTNQKRVESMMEALRQCHIARSPGPQLFLFVTHAELHASDPLSHSWHDGHGRSTRLV